MRRLVRGRPAKLGPRGAVHSEHLADRAVGHVAESIFTAAEHAPE